MVSVVVPIYNEFEMVNEIHSRVDNVFKELENYDYELVFFDDGSSDGTCEAIEALCAKHKEVKAVFYSKNFGYLKNTFYAMQQAKGDCAILLHADLQNPPEKIPEFIEKWENGANIVLGIKNKSHENTIIYFLRTIFYFIMIHIFDVKLTPHATEFELFDQSFINTLNKVDINQPFLRGIVSEYSGKKDFVYYTQNARKKGKSKFNLNKYYDFAICGIVQYSTNIPRKCILFNLICIALLFIEFFVLYLPHIKELSITNLSIGFFNRLTVLILFLLFIFISIVFEYIIFSIKNIGNKPFIIEEKRIDY